MAEIDSLLQTVMFTIYGNQYESREEHLLLTMFQVWNLHIQSVDRANCVRSLSLRTNSIILPTILPYYEPTLLFHE